MHRSLGCSCLIVTLACSPAGGGGQAESWSPTTTADETSSGVETGEPEPELGICQRYLDCVAEVAPDMQMAAEDYYGSSGACWTTEGANDCLEACRLFLASLSGAFPAVEACHECAEDADCPAQAPFCHLDKGQCNEEQQILSCDAWGIAGSCREFGDGFTLSERREWCDADDASLGNGWMSASPLPCKTEGAWGYCDIYYLDVDLPTGAMQVYFYSDNPDAMWTAANAEDWCVFVEGTWVPF